MASRLTVFQMVALHLGQDEEILDPEDETKLGRAIRTAWDMARRDTLRQNNWNFAMTQARLPAMSEAPLLDFTYQFILPADFVRLADVISPTVQTRDWSLEGGKLMANAAPLDIKYVRDETNVAIWDDNFAMGMSWRIAELTAISITGDANVAQWCGKQFEVATGSAQANDAVENPPVEFDEDTWLQARWRGGAGSWEAIRYGRHG
jgi:hypothetical protein